jgi:hypothetical protein
MPLRQSAHRKAWIANGPAAVDTLSAFVQALNENSSGEVGMPRLWWTEFGPCPLDGAAGGKPRPDRSERHAVHLRLKPPWPPRCLAACRRLFPAETGLTLDARRQKARLIWAVGRMSAGAGVTATALDCGYDSPSAFIAAFRRQFGVTSDRNRPAAR